MKPPLYCFCVAQVAPGPGALALAFASRLAAAPASAQSTLLDQRIIEAASWPAVGGDGRQEPSTPPRARPPASPDAASAFPTRALPSLTPWLTERLTRTIHAARYAPGGGHDADAEAVSPLREDLARLQFGPRFDAPAQVPCLPRGASVDRPPSAHLPLQQPPARPPLLVPTQPRPRWWRGLPRTRPRALAARRQFADGEVVEVAFDARLRVEVTHGVHVYA